MMVSTSDNLNEVAGSIMLGSAEMQVPNSSENPSLVTFINNVLINVQAVRLPANPAPMGLPTPSAPAPGLAAPAPSSQSPETDCLAVIEDPMGQCNLNNDFQAIQHDADLSPGGHTLHIAFAPFRG